VLRALIFDLDGTLADTEETHRQAFNAAFVQFELWWDWGPQRYAELLRVSGGKERIVHYIGTLAVPQAERARLMELVPALHRTKTHIYIELLEQGRRPFRPGVLRLLREAKSRRLALAIASTSSSASVAALLRANLANEPGIAFDVIACADQVPAKKPAPDIYTLALSSLRLAADECIAFEDSANGVRAAKAAGLVAVVTPTRWNVDQDYRGADLVQPSLDEPPLDIARLELLLGGTRAAA
jgi:HAD superfamily hydrolase (TIGR01509 family)